ncbi:MAG: NeuD/PglB/VioB family sugar acetyltransferase [Candidatus Rokuibacteriota bacterium]
MARRLLIVGAGGHARAVADLAAECDWEVAGFAERPGAPPRPEVLGDDSDLAALARGARIDAAVVGVGNSALQRRTEIFQRLGQAGLATPALVHPRATVSRSARIGDGTTVFAGAVLGAGVEIGENAVLYSGVIVEHECRIADHAYLSPGVVLSGEVVVGPGALLGSGAVVLPGVTIGRDAVVAAGAVVTSDVKPGQTVMGVPARARNHA